MAEINNNEQPKGKKNNAKRLSTKIDMTPMVDLAFLLLTFFMLTTTFNKPRSMEINMPVPGPGEPVNNALTILVGGKNKLTYYQGEFDPANKASFHSSGFTNNQIRNELMEINQKLIDRISAIEEDFANGVIDKPTYNNRIRDAKKNKDNHGIFVIIKASDDASYASIVKIIDEMKICGVINYAIVDITKEEEKMLVTL